MVIDGDAEVMHTIPLQVDIIRANYQKWPGITRCQNKLFCAPSNSSDVLVIDGENEKTQMIPYEDVMSCEREKGIGILKWSGITTYGNNLFCATRAEYDILLLQDGLTLIQNKSNSIVKRQSSTSTTCFFLTKWLAMIATTAGVICMVWNCNSLSDLNGQIDGLSVDNIMCPR